MEKSLFGEAHSFIDAIHGTIKYNGLERMIIESPVFMRLHRVYQSSLVYLTYPSNKVKRFEHSLGTMHLSGDFLYCAVCNSDRKKIERLIQEVCKRFVDEWNENNTYYSWYDKEALSDLIVEQRLNGVITGIDSKCDYDSIFGCELYRLHTPLTIKESDRFPYFVIFEAVRLSGLLHDIGHLPYSHVMEYALEDFYKSLRKEGLHTSSFAGQVLGPFFPADKNEKKKTPPIHELLGQTISKHVFDSFKKIVGIESEAFNHAHALFVIMVIWLTRKILGSGKNENSVYADLHAIISGIVDCDRMDYCSRDLLCSGVIRAPLSYDRIFSEVKIFYMPASADRNEEKARERCFFYFSAKSISQIEGLLRARYEDYATINFHHRVHKHEELLKSVIIDLCKSTLNNEKKTLDEMNVLGLDMNSLFITIDNAKRGQSAIDIQFPQLDDEWLNAVIKRFYYNEYGTLFSDRSRNRNREDWNRYDELIYGEKHYLPLFRREAAFVRFREKLLEKRGLDAKSLVRFFGAGDGLGCMREEKFYEGLNDKLKEWCKKDGSNLTDCFAVPNNFNIGLKASELEDCLLVSSNDKKEPIPLKSVSNIHDELGVKKDMFPLFHVFYLPRYNEKAKSYMEVNVDDLTEGIIPIINNAVDIFEEEKRKKREEEN